MMMSKGSQIQIKTLQITIATEEDSSFCNAEALVYEQDTSLILNQTTTVRDSGETLEQLIAQMDEMQEITPGSVIIQGRDPLNFFAIVHDFDKDPSWKEEWIETVLHAIFREVESRKLQSMATPLLGTVYGSLEKRRFLILLRSAIENTSFVSLKQLWLIVPAEVNYDDCFNILKQSSPIKSLKAQKKRTEECEQIIPKRQLAAIMFTDIVGYSKSMEANEMTAYLRLMSHHEIIRANIVKYNGREIKTIGDAFLVMFSSAVESVDCALAIQMELSEYNRNKADSDKILVRIGIHLGDVLIVENDVLGNSVNIAARIEPLAEPGGICISEAIYNIVKKKMSIFVKNLGACPLKNIAESQEIYSIVFSHPKP